MIVNVGERIQAISAAAIQEFGKIMLSGHVAFFLPRLSSLEILMREADGKLQSLAAVCIEQQWQRDQSWSLLDIKQFLKNFKTTEQLQASCC